MIEFMKPTVWYLPTPNLSILGCLKVLQCTKPDCNQIWEVDLEDLPGPDLLDAQLRFTGDITLLPSCPKCNSLARPNVSMFGDTNYTWNASRSSCQKKEFKRWLKKILGTNPKALKKRAIVPKPKEEKVERNQPPCRRSARVRAPNLAILEIGCGVSLHSLRLEVDLLCSLDTKASVRLIRINPHHHDLPEGDHVAIGIGAKEALQGIWQQIKEQDK